MQITRVYSDKDGESHFEEIEIELKSAGEIGRLSDNYPVENIIFRENDPDYDYDWHPAPKRQYIILLDGEIELEVSDGEKRVFKGGDIIFVEDISGKGHRTKSITDKPRRSIFVTID
jgi:hypothetical protein